jgi:hypothetical protein
VLLLCVVAAGCNQAEGGARTSGAQSAAVPVISNDGEGLDAGKIREELRTLWTAGGAPDQPNLGTVLFAETDPDGNVYVLDHADQQVTKLSRDGRFVKKFGGRGQAPGGLSKARRFAFVDGRLYFANYGNGRVEVLGSSGEVFPPVHLPEVKQPGELFYANERFFIERRFAPSGHVLYAYERNWKLDRALVPAHSTGDPDDVPRSFNTACAGPDGIWIVYMLTNRIQKASFDGKVLLETSRALDWKFPTDQDGKVLPEFLIHRACAVDPAGNLYVVFSNPKDWKRGNDVYKFGPDGRLRQLAFTLPVFNSNFINFDREGNFYYTDGAKLIKASIERKEAS